MYDIKNSLYYNNTQNFTVKDYLDKSENIIIIKNKKYNFLEAIRLLWCYIVDLNVIIQIEKSKFSKIFILLGNNHVNNLLYTYKKNVLYTRKVINEAEDSCLRINGNIFIEEYKKSESSIDMYKNIIKKKREKDKIIYNSLPNSKPDMSMH